MKADTKISTTYRQTNELMKGNTVMTWRSVCTCFYSFKKIWPLKNMTEIVCFGICAHLSVTLCAGTNICVYVNVCMNVSVSLSVYRSICLCVNVSRCLYTCSSLGLYPCVFVVFLLLTW